jgi:hypothetical protein
VDINNNIRNKTTTTTTILTVLFVSIFHSSINNQLTFIAHGARPDVGFQDGLSDCQTGTSNAINGHSNAEHHSDEYMAAYKRGLASCSNSGSSSDINQGITGGNVVTGNEPLTQPPTLVAPQQSAAIQPQQEQTEQVPPFNLDNNTIQSNETTFTFVPICNLLQTSLNYSCDQLVDPNGNLTRLGNSTVKCIVANAILGVGATVLEITPNFVNSSLDALSGPVSCGEIVKIDQLNNLLSATGNMKGIVNQLIKWIH